MPQSTSLTTRVRVRARVKATASVILNEYLMCESSVDAAHLIEDLGAPRCRHTFNRCCLNGMPQCSDPGGQTQQRDSVHTNSTRRPPPPYTHLGPDVGVGCRYHAALIKRLLTAAMDKSEAEQDMAATLVSSLCVRGVVHDRDCEAGLEELLKSLRDGPGSLGLTPQSTNACLGCVLM